MTYSFSAVSLLILLVALVTALRAITTSRTPQGAVGWVIFIIAVPVFAIPLYFVLGHASYQSFIRARRAADAAVARPGPPARLRVPAPTTEEAQDARRAAEAVPEAEVAGAEAAGAEVGGAEGAGAGEAAPAAAPAGPRSAAPPARAPAARLGQAAAPSAPGARLDTYVRLADTHAYRGNGVDLLIDGAETTAAVLAAIETAQDYVLVQYYIIRADSAGERLKQALCRKAHQGVAVRVLYNAFQGFGLPRRYLADLQEAGVEVHVLKGPRRPLGRFQINFRNHRKAVVVDGIVGFTGGLNVGEEYLGRDPTYGAWRDTHVRLHGPLVTQLQALFVADWHWTAGTDITGEVCDDPGADPRDLRGLVLGAGPTDMHPTGNLYFCALANDARDRLWIATPYCVPDTEVLATLKLAAIRGVDVRILAPGNADHYLPWLAAFAYFDELRAAGVSIWTYDEGFMHQKVVLVDDDLSSIGTINLDVRSGLLNFEETVIVEDRGFASEVEAMLEADFARARPCTTTLDEHPLWLRLAAPSARLLAPLL